VATSPMREVTAAQRLGGHVQHRQMIGHEEGIELRGLELLREARQMGEIEIRIREGARITPCARVETDGPHEGAEMQFAIICHWASLSSMFWLARRVAKGSAAGRPLLIATISPPGDWRGKDYSDYDFGTERFLLKFCIWR